MEYTNDSNKAKEAANSGGTATAAAPRRPHWRHRDRSATAVYVVHPSQFRTVVQQLTGAATTSQQQHPIHGRSGGNDNGASAANNAAAQQYPGRVRVQEEEMKSNMEQRTLAQMHHDCMAWAHEY